MAAPKEISTCYEELEYSVCKVHKANREDNPVVVESGSGVLVQCLPGMLDDEAVATATLSSAPTVTFVAGSGTALPWLERGVMGCRRGDILHASDAEGRVAYTVSIRFVAAAPATQTEDRVTRADEHRKLGNELLKKKVPKRLDVRDAILSYNRALQILAAEPDFAERAAPLRLNIALAQLRLQEWAPVTRQCDIVLASDPTNTKALFRRGRAHFELEAFQAAISDFRAAKKLSAGDVIIANSLEEAVNKLYRLVQMNRQLFAQTYNKMVSSPVFDKQSTSV